MSDFSSYTQTNPVPTATSQPGIFSKYVTNPIKNAISGGAKQIAQSYNQGVNTNNPGTLLESGLGIASGAANILSSPLAPITQPTIGAGVNAASNAISNNTGVQNFANSGAGKAVAKGAEDIGNVSNVAGTVAGGMQLHGLFTDHPIFKSGSALDTATQARNTAAQQGVNAINDISGTMSDFKGDLGHSFQEGAANIEKTNPGLKVTIPHEILDSLNELKDTKKFQLPDYLRKTTREFGSSDVADIQKGGISLGPTEAQDLVTRLNKLTYDAKASGDLAVNQQTIGLTNQIKQLTHGTFGDEWGKIYKQYSEGKNAIENFKNIVDIRKSGDPVAMNKSLESIKKLSSTPEGKIILQNSVNEFKNVSGYDLTNPTETIGKILDSEEAFKQASKPGFLKQVTNPVYMARLGVRLVTYATLGYFLRNEIKKISPP